MRFAATTCLFTTILIGCQKEPERAIDRPLGSRPAAPQPVVEKVEPGEPAAPFTLTDQRGEPFDSASLKGKVWLGSIFFANCPGPCFRENQAVADILREIDDSGDFGEERVAGLRLVDHRRDHVEEIGRTDEIVRCSRDHDALHPGMAVADTADDVHAVARRKLTIDDQQIDPLERRQPLGIHHVGPGCRHLEPGHPAHEPNEQIQQQRVVIDDHALHGLAIRGHG